MSGGYEAWERGGVGDERGAMKRVTRRGSAGLWRGSAAR